MQAVALAQGTRRGIVPFRRRLYENAKEGNQFGSDRLITLVNLRSPLAILTL